MNEDDYDDEPVDPREQLFNNSVREHIIFLLLLILLYSASYAIIRYFKRRENDEYFSIDEDEVMVYRISMWLCTFSLAIAIGAALLLPISILSNDILIFYSNCYYVKWLNHSLIQSFWNNIFLFSNISMFFFLPFAYLFTESEGFLGHRKGLIPRIYETFTVLSLVVFILFGLTYIVSACIDGGRLSFVYLFDFSYYLPFLYSCISFFGVLMLLVCTPLGFAKLFDLLNNVLAKPQFMHNVQEEYNVCIIEEQALERKLIALDPHILKQSPDESFNQTLDHIHEISNTFANKNGGGNIHRLYHERNGKLGRVGSVEESIDDLREEYFRVRDKRTLLEKQCHTSSFRRNIVYPLAILLLTTLTGLTTLLVIQNTIELLIGFKALPHTSRQFSLGIHSLSRLGPVGDTLEIVLIVYLIVTSYIGLYSCPPMRQIRPKPRRTPFSQIVGNCILILIFSSALPLLSKILGITNFDLLGDFAQIEWLGNFKLVLFYNVVFAGAIALCLANKFTARVRRELYDRLVEALVSRFCSHIKVK